jgi:hypothetical protein
MNRNNIFWQRFTIAFKCAFWTGVCSGAIGAQGGLSVAGGCRCLTKDSNTSIEKEGYIPYSLQA